MPKQTLADKVQSVIMTRTPHEVTHVQRAKSEGSSRHARVKAVHVEVKRIKFRVYEPGICEEISVVSNNTLETVSAVSSALNGTKVKFEVVGKAT